MYKEKYIKTLVQWKREIEVEKQQNGAKNKVFFYINRLIDALGDDELVDKNAN